MVYLFLDTETTGIDTENDYIISFSFKMLEDDKLIWEDTIEMNPFTSLEEAKDPKYAKAFEVNGYTPEQIMTFIPSKIGMEKVSNVFKLALERNNGFWPKVVGYNSNGYDLPIIKSNAKRFGVVLPNIGFSHIDLLQMIWALDGMGKLPLKKNSAGKILGNRLCESVEKFGIEADATKFHGSAYDVEMTYQLFLKLKQTLTVNI